MLTKTKAGSEEGIVSEAHRMRSVHVSAASKNNLKQIRGSVSKEVAMLRWWGVVTNVWFINRVDYYR